LGWRGLVGDLMYEWGTNALPVGTFDGQVHVDARGKVR
jgi:hypothetical protein